MELASKILGYLKALPDTVTAVTKEALSVKFKVAEHEVAQALHILNLQGYVRQPAHLPPHDSKRDRWTPGINELGTWMPDKYYLTAKVRGD